MRKIVAIGGGELKDNRHLLIHKEIVRLSARKHPRVLFIPTASYDTHDYDGIINEVYGKKLGCAIDFLYLLSTKMSQNQIKEKILGADIIYVPGGNALKMMKLWRKMSIDVLLKAAWDKGTVLSGISAGAICWFESGHSDSMSHYHPKKWSYIRVKGLGFIEGVLCPHYNGGTLGKKRKNNFQEMIKKSGAKGIGIEDDCALEIIDDKFRVISAKNALAYKIYKKNKTLIEEQIKIKKELTPVATLFASNSERKNTQFSDKLTQ